MIAVIICLLNNTHYFFSLRNTISKKSVKISYYGSTTSLLTSVSLKNVLKKKIDITESILRQNSSSTERNPTYGSEAVKQCTGCCGQQYFYKS